MSTKKEMLGKENRKENGHRRYSLLLLALLFIGFASYGTYAYFSNSTSTQNGHLTLNGMSQEYNIGGSTDGKTDTKTGDGTTNIETDNKYEYNPDPDNNGQGDGKGEFKEVVDKDGTDQDELQNSTQFGEFPWVYVGNDVEAASSENLFTRSFDLNQYNSYITSEEDNTVFGNVVEGDVFRKTVRLAVKGKSKVPVTAKLIWAGVKDEDKDFLDHITAAAYVHVDDQTDDEKAQPFANFADPNIKFDELIKITSDKHDKHTEKIGQVKAGQYIDVELVAAVNKGAGTNKDKDAKVAAQLAKIARELSIHLEQQTDDVIKDKDKTQPVVNK